MFFLSRITHAALLSIEVAGAMIEFAVIGRDPDANRKNPVLRAFLRSKPLASIF